MGIVAMTWVGFAVLEKKTGSVGWLAACGLFMLSLLLLYLYVLP